MQGPELLLLPRVQENLQHGHQAATTHMNCHAHMNAALKRLQTGTNLLAT
jgi:hypothetical protein